MDVEMWYPSLFVAILVEFGIEKDLIVALFMSTKMVLVA